MTLGSTAIAAEPVKVEPWFFDPAETGVAEANWETDQGLPDVGRSSHALKLTKNADTSTFAASGATIPFTGTLTELGFDYRADGWCGAGAPRFNVHTDQGTFFFFFGCIHGEMQTTDDSNWQRVRFADG
jgi:hypothetical protein